MSVLIFEVGRGEKDLRHGVIICRELLVIYVHQLALTDRRAGLLACDVAGTLAEIQLADSHADSTRGDEYYLFSRVLYVADGLAQLLNAADILATALVSEC